MRLRASAACLRAGLCAHLLAFVLLPAAHQLRHRNDHTHDASGRVEAISLAHGHAHDGGVAHTHAPPTAAPELARAFAASAALELLAHAPATPAHEQAPMHGRGGAAHFAAALLVVTTFAYLPAIDAVDALSPPELRSAALATRPLGAASARGPPA